MPYNVTSELMEYKWISEVINTMGAKSKGLLLVNQQRKEANRTCHVSMSCMFIDIKWSLRTPSNDYFLNYSMLFGY